MDRKSRKSLRRSLTLEATLKVFPDFSRQPIAETEAEIYSKKPGVSWKTAGVSRKSLRKPLNT